MHRRLPNRQADGFVVHPQPELQQPGFQTPASRSRRQSRSGLA